MDTYVCDQCGIRFLLQLDNRPLRCALHGENDHCHVGESIVDAEGRQILWVAPLTCLPYATAEQAE